MPINLLGKFYFKKTTNGNLLGEFSNNIDNIILTESADLDQDDSESYLGDYNSTWQQNGKPCFANLKISQKPGIRNKIFILNWKVKGGILIFKGEGMLCDNILIGDYQKV